MRAYFRYMASYTGRIVRGMIGFSIMAWGYSKWQYPDNIWIMIGGLLFLVMAIANISLLAPLFGYSVSGKRIIEMHGEITGLPGEEASYRQPHAKKMTEVNPADPRSDGRAKYHTGTTTGAGSNYGQGSMQLDANAYKQGDTRSAGSNYDNEQSQANRQRNINPDEQSSAAGKNS